MKDDRTAAFLRKYIWLVPPADEIVIDFIRQARLGEVPRLVVTGRMGTGKTRLGVVLKALTGAVVYETGGGQARSVRKIVDFFEGSNPLVVIADWDQKPLLAALRQHYVVVALPLIWSQALRESGVDLEAGEHQIRRAANAFLEAA